MLKKVIIVLATVFSALSYGNNMDAPRYLVQSFIADYQQWNDQAYRLSESEIEYTGEAMKMAEDLYWKNIISKYCRPGFKGQPIAFGSESSHDSEREVIITEEIEGSISIITTKHTSSTGFVADYEYRLTKNNGRWYLEAVDYVDADGKYPGL